MSLDTNLEKHAQICLEAHCKPDQHFFYIKDIHPETSGLFFSGQKIIFRHFKIGTFNLGLPPTQ